jgi:hypothetical protein
VRIATTLVLLLACGALTARADDWPQFRRDANRSAASKDELKFPLEARWNWTTKSKAGHSPLYYATIWKNKAFFTASEGGQRFLICADAKTGKVQWQRALQTEKLEFVLSDIAGPAVTESGLVYVYDWMTESSLRGGFPLNELSKQGTTSSGAVERMNSFTVRVFDARTGDERTLFPLAAMGANGVLPRLSLTEDGDGQEVRPVPPTFVGCPP